MLVDSVFLKITSKSDGAISSLMDHETCISELELPNRDKTHINMSLEVLDILKVSLNWV